MSPRARREIPQRELRNNVGAVLREVERGATVRVTVRGRPVADVVPVVPEHRPQFVPRTALERLLLGLRPDPGFRRELRDALPDTIDQLS